MSDSSCPAITEPVTTANIAIDAIFLLGGGTLFTIWFIGRLAQIRTKSILKWYLYGFALIFYCLCVSPSASTVANQRRSLTLNLAFTVLQACNIGNFYSITRGFVAVEWFWQFTHWMILANVMLNLCGALFRATTGSGRLVYFISAPILLLIGILMIAYLGLYAAEIQNYDPYAGYYVDQNTQGQLNTAELVFNIIGAIVVCIFIVVALGQMSSRNIRVGVRLPGSHVPANNDSLSRYGFPSSCSFTSDRPASASPTTSWSSTRSPTPRPASSPCGRSRTCASSS
jgi:hypothetical protein